MKKSLALLFTVMLAVTLLSGCGGGKETLKVGMECDYAPFNWTQIDDANGAVKISNDATGYANGYDVQIAVKIAAELDMELEIVKTDWDGLIPALTSGKIDLIIAGMSPSDERKETIDFSDYYYESDLVIVVKKDGPFDGATALADFAGAKITGQLSTTHYTVIDQIPDVDKQTAQDTFPAMVISLTSGKIDGYVSERPGALDAVKANPEQLSFVGFEEGKGFIYDVNESFVSVGVKKDSDLTAKVNAALGKISKAQRAELMQTAVDNPK